MMAVRCKVVLVLANLLLLRLQLQCLAKSCSERKVLYGNDGIISDGPNDYPTNAHCEWLIDAGSPNKTIQLTFRSMATECSFDFLFIYDGKSYDSPLIASLSGNTLPTQVIARSGYMLLHLFSDRNYSESGLEARYILTECPMFCHHHGVCENNKCRCRNQRRGDACQYHMCPNDCAGRGTCTAHTDDPNIYSCRCDPGYIGQNCSLSTMDQSGVKQWYQLVIAEEKFPARTSHAAVFIAEGEAECMWMYGGFDLNNLLDDLVRYCINNNTLETIPQSDVWPSPRRGHAMAAFDNGFFMFGGVIANSSQSNELWYFNITTMAWTQKAANSVLKPPAVSGHTLTAVDDWMYLFGGKTLDKVATDMMFRIHAREAQEWQVVPVLGGRYPQKRLVGHSAVYHKESRSLLIFGGYIQRSALESVRTNEFHTFHLDHLYWSHINNNIWVAPEPLAFHTAVILGNYMLVYGGIAHEHYQMETCYSNALHFYHLGCHMWINQTHFTNREANMGLSKGRFGHVAVGVKGNILLIAGGYAGQVLDDIVAFKVPPSVSPHESLVSQDLDHCLNYTTQMGCLTDPECMYCRAGRMNTSMPGCVHRTMAHMCKGGDIQDIKSLRCPGICAALHSCGACTSQGQGPSLTPMSPRRRIYNEECIWCVKESQCQAKAMPLTTCKKADGTRSGIQGWWNGSSEVVSQLPQCRTLDFPAGLHWLQFRSPSNLSYPDNVKIIQETAQSLQFDYRFRYEIDKRFEFKAHLVGFIHPLNAPPRGTRLEMVASLDNGHATLYMSRDDKPWNTENVLELKTQNVLMTGPVERPDRSPVFPNVARGFRYFLQEELLQTVASNPQHKDPTLPTSSLVLKWNINHTSQKEEKITAEFLEPYSNGTCWQHYNCLGCLTDVQCGWQEAGRLCLNRNPSPTATTTTPSPANATFIVQEQAEYLITTASECPRCDNLVDCWSCAQDPLCEWIKEDGHCTRRMRFANAVRNASECRPPCYNRTSCSECIAMRDECAWCHNTQTCLPFSDYFTSYVYGQCTSWADNISLSHHCHQCELFTDCKKCLAHYGCGWCWNEDNPTIGRCVSGDFTGPESQSNCSALISEVFEVTAMEPASWTYHECPSVDECLLGLHTCPEHSECHNLPNAYVCQCVRGYEKDSSDQCVKTCYYECKHGNCSESPDYVCLCERGWTGDDCNTDCGCNHHSTCRDGVGLCDDCQDGTMGNQCQFCKTGYYGNPQSPEGCVPCQCNGHGSLTLGQCNNETGECYCTDNAEGDHCEVCQPGYYGDPSNGGQCYLQCDDRTILTNVKRGGLGTSRGRGILGLPHAYCLWLVTIFPDIATARTAAAFNPQSIKVTIEGDLEVKCGKHYIYVYDGVPSFINGSSPETDRAVLLGAICGDKPGTDFVMMATSGILTIYFEVDMRGWHSTGFNATYEVLNCQSVGSCQCEAGFMGLNCDVPVCPLNCSSHLDQGTCNRLTGRCQCETGYFGEGCEKVIKSDVPYLVPLVDPTTWSGYPWNIPPPRVGHTLTSCGEGELFLFGGYWVQKGLRSDTWVFDIETQQWESVLPLDQQPSGRYYHSAACIPSLKLIYVFGGLVQKGPGRKFAPTNELWKFNYESKVWTNESVPAWLPELAGHTLTHVGDTKLVLMGGISADNYFSDKVFEYDARRGFMAWQEFGPANLSGTALTGVYGHSAVYYDHQKTIYMYGGYVFRDTKWEVSSHLFAFDVPNRQWNLLTAEKLSDYEERVFHVAVGLHDEMAVIGGWRENHSYAPDILIYKYTCNTWHRVPIPEGSMGKGLISAIGLGAAADQGRVFVFGGYAGETRGTLLEVKLPKDVCALIQDHLVCSNISGCSLCSKDNTYVCQATVSRDGASVLQGCRSKHGLQSNKPCNYDWHANRDCYRYTTCSQCLAIYPNFREASPACKWCTRCTANGPGRCIPRNRDCDCKSKTDIEEVEDCFEMRCVASTCARCVAQKTCAWTRNFKPSTETTRFWAHDPVFDWSCVPMSMFKTQEGEMEPCQDPCHIFTSCSTCLASDGGEGGSQSCVWSETLKECMAPAYVPLRCSYGECGVLMERPKGSAPADVCPQQCVMNTKCADCVTKPGCGWCAFGGLNGMGLCMPGGLAGPTHGVCTEQNITMARETPIATDLDANLDMRFLATILENAENNMRGASGAPTWSFGQCPPENECTNSHHTCDPQTQVCVDTPTYFKCSCKDGYIKTQVGTCKPVCHQGCSKHGTCVRPDKCQCHFGYVGDNCSVECQCNKHSNCKSATETDICLECMNNTMGLRCERCKPLFVGDPRNGGRCVPCSEFCNNHTDICMLRSQYKVMETLNFKEIVRRAYKTPKNDEYGPEEDEAVCVGCGQNTRGERCERCLEGYFRLTNQPSTEPCMKCQCNGHSDTCHEHTGEHCQCRNNTESKCDSKDNSPPCWQVQCSACKEYFLGKPTNGHQCYRQMAVDKDFCYDPETQKNCNTDPSPLLKGRTVFFYVQPKYLNVDIRITIDVTLGGVDVYLANKEEIFQVEVDRQTGVHIIRLDNQFQVVDMDTKTNIYHVNRRKRSLTLTSSAPAKVYQREEVRANELNTFITVKHKNTILVVREVRFRLVITLPRHYHELQNTQFFIILKSLHNITSGSLYFRQDQPHIDLFVFFSVFFSCFFLFLAVCVLLWKMKTTLDLRRSRQMRAREMQCMASRPSAKVIVLLDVKNPVTLPITTLTSRRPRPIRTSFRNLHMVDLSPQHPLPLQRDDGLSVVPVAIEPTDDGIAAVATVIMQLPGGASTPSKLCLGSALTMRISPPVPATKGSQRHHRLSASSC